MEFTTSVGVGVLLFVGGNQGKEFALSVKGSGGEWLHDAPFRVGDFPDPSSRHSVTHVDCAGLYKIVLRLL